MYGFKKKLILWRWDVKKVFSQEKKKTKKISVLFFWHILISYYHPRRKEGLGNAFLHSTLHYKMLEEEDSTGWGQSMARELLGGPYWKHPSVQARGSHPYNWSGDASEQATTLEKWAFTFLRNRLTFE